LIWFLFSYFKGARIDRSGQNVETYICIKEEVLVSKSYEKNPLLSLWKDKCERGYWRRSDSDSVCRWVQVCCGFACECRSEFICSLAAPSLTPVFCPCDVFSFHRLHLPATCPCNEFFMTISPTIISRHKPCRINIANLFYVTMLF